MHLIDNPDILARWDAEQRADAVDDLDSVIEELFEVARGDRTYGDEGAQLMAVDKLRERAESALGVLQCQERNHYHRETVRVRPEARTAAAS